MYIQVTEESDEKPKYTIFTKKNKQKMIRMKLYEK